MSFVMWVLVAVLAGLLAGFVMKPGSYGRGWDIALGLAGSVVVSWLFERQWAVPIPVWSWWSSSQPSARRA